MAERYVKLKHASTEDLFRKPTEEELKTYYIPYVLTVARLFSEKRRTFDPESEALHALATAVHKYDPEREPRSSFSHYVDFLLIGALRRDATKHRASFPIENLDATNEHGWPRYPELGAEDPELQRVEDEILSLSLLSRLKDGDKAIILLLYWGDMDLVQVGQSLGVSTKAVVVVRNRVLTRFRRLLL